MIKRQVLIGQRASQTLTFSIDNLENDGENERLVRIIDQLIQINGIELNQIYFGVRNNTEFFSGHESLPFKKQLKKRISMLSYQT
jgi:hypothetical protein